MSQPLGRRFAVHISDRATADLEQICAYIARDSPANAVRMRAKLERAIDALAFMPRRHPFAPEQRRTGGDVRHVIVWPFRVVYEVRARSVQVHLVRHGAMMPADDL